MNSSHLFPVEASVLSGEALLETLQAEYPSDIQISFCRLHYRSIHDTYVVMCGVSRPEIRFYFKVYRYGLRSKEEIQAEVDLLLHLKQSGIRATEPIVRKDGSYICNFRTIQGVRYGVLFTSVGVRQYTEADETGEFSAQFGRYIGSVHHAWDGIHSELSRWQLDERSFIDVPMQHIREFAGIYPVDVPFLERVAEQVKRGLKQLTREKPEYGMCHGDLYAGNVRIDEDGSPVLFDFDFCGYGWRAYDLCLYLNPFSWGCDPSKKDRLARRREAFLAGYAASRPVTDAEIANLNLFTAMRRVFNIGTLYISMANTWGDNWVLHNLNQDVETLKKWVDMNAF